MKKRPETITAFLGVLYSGCFYVPLDDEMPRYRIELILKELRPAACICDEATLNTARGLDNTGTVYVYGDIAVGEIDLRRARGCALASDRHGSHLYRVHLRLDRKAERRRRLPPRRDRLHRKPVRRTEI